MKQHRGRMALAVTLTSISVVSTELSRTPASQIEKDRENQTDVPRTLSRKKQFEIKERRMSGIVILDLIGQFNPVTSNLALKKAISDLLARRERKIILNLEGITSINSSAMRGFASNLQLVNSANGQLKVLKPSKAFEALLISLRPSSEFEIYYDELKAAKSFGSSPAPIIPPNKMAKKRCESKVEVDLLVKQLVIDELGIKTGEVTGNARIIEDLGADSLDVVELIMRIEEEFGIEIPDEDAAKFKTVDNVSSYVFARLCAS